jgi:hypothetical protein
VLTVIRLGILVDLEMIILAPLKKRGTRIENRGHAKVIEKRKREVRLGHKERRNTIFVKIFFWFSY